MSAQIAIPAELKPSKAVSAVKKVRSRTHAADQEPTVRRISKSSAKEHPKLQFLSAIIAMTENRLVLRRIEDAMAQYGPELADEVRDAKTHPLYVKRQRAFNDEVGDATVAMLKLYGKPIHKDMLELVLDLCCEVSEWTERIRPFKNGLPPVVACGSLTIEIDPNLSDIAAGPGLSR